jgi:hypothetical protein
MKCMDCQPEYIGQVGRTFHTIHKEYIQAIRNISDNSGYSSHTLNTVHASGSITDTMEVVKIEKKENTWKHSKNIIYCDMSASCWVAQQSVARQPSAKRLATKHTLRGGAGRWSLLRAAAITSHGSALVSKVTPVNTVTQHSSHLTVAPIRIVNAPPTQHSSRR